MTTNDSPSETSLPRNPLKLLATRLSGPTEPAEPPTKRLQISVCLHLLAQDRRRRIIEALIAASDLPLSLAALAERVACAEYDCQPEALNSAQRNRVYTALYQSHLPALTEADVLAYDDATNHVDSGPAFEYLVRMYDAIMEVAA